MVGGREVGGRAGGCGHHPSMGGGVGPTDILQNPVQIRAEMCESTIFPTAVVGSGGLAAGLSGVGGVGEGNQAPKRNVANPWLMWTAFM